LLQSLSTTNSEGDRRSPEEFVKLIHDCCPYFHQQLKHKTDNIMSLLLTNECIITGCGYKCCEYETDSDLPSEDRRILVTLWVKYGNGAESLCTTNSEGNLRSPEEFGQWAEKPTTTNSEGDLRSPEEFGELIQEMKRVFPSQESLYQQMLVFVKSPLADYSDMHRSKAFMGREFIQYYEKNMTKPNRRVT